MYLYTHRNMCLEPFENIFLYTSEIYSGTTDVNLLQYLMMQKGGTESKTFNTTRLTVTLK